MKKGTTTYRHRFVGKSMLQALVVCVLVVGVAACGGATTPPAPAGEEPDAAASPVTDTSPAAETTESPPAEEASPAGEASPSPEAEGAPPAQPGSYAQAPMLAERVEAGDLPPLEERLPPEPLVVQPVEEVGQYGGTWRMAIVGDDTGWFNMINMVEPFLRWNMDATGHIPTLLRDYEWNEDATEVVGSFREGIKWSDGSRSPSTTTCSGGTTWS